MRKKIVLLLMLAISLSSMAQVDFNPPKNKLEVETSLNYLVEEFIDEARERGFYVRSYLIENVDGIYFYNAEKSTLDEDNLGIVSTDYRRVYIHQRLIDEPLLLKITFFHELGHALNKSDKHTCEYCPEIMSKYSLDDLSPFKNKKKWESMLDTYFKWLDEE